MDSTQFLLTVVLTVTTILLIVVGWHLIFLIRDLRKALARINAIFDAFEKVGSSLDHGLSELQGFVTGFKTISKVIDIFHKSRNGRSK